MKGAPAAVLIAMGGVALLLAWRGGAFAPVRRPAQTAGAGPQGGPIGGGGSLGSLLAPLAATGLPGALAAIAGGAVDTYVAAPPETQEVYKGILNRAHDVARSSVTGRILGKLGVIPGGGQTPTEKRREKRQGLIAAQATITQESEGAEAWGAKVSAALALPNVEWWRFGQDGALEVQYSGRSGMNGPWRLDVPRTAVNPAAWLAEWSTRVFGGVVRSGRGPVTESFTTYGRERVGFESTNPYAPTRWQAPELTEELLRLQGAVARSLRRPEPTELS